MTDRVAYLNPHQAGPRLGAYSHVAVAAPGRFAFIAGQVAVDDSGKTVAPGNLQAQVPVVFDNLARILQGLGVGFTDVVQFTSYVTGDDCADAWREARDDVYRRLYPDGAYPPNTLLVISGLAKPEFRVEISAIARLPD